MLKILLAASALALSGGAQAATVVFDPGSGTLPGGQSVLTDFDSEVAGPGFIFQTGSNGNGALPAFGAGSDRYLSVLGGGTYSITFGPTSVFGFDLGSLDFYNTLVLTFVGGATQTFLGGQIIGLAGQAVPNSGDQQIAQTNGRVTYTGTGGQLINGATFSSSTNSFEVDRLSVAAVPEPATWAMMIFGFVLVGSAMRLRRRRISTVTA